MLKLIFRPLIFFGFFLYLAGFSLGMIVGMIIGVNAGVK